MSSAAPKPTPSHPRLLALAAALGRQAAREDHAARKATAQSNSDNDGEDRQPRRQKK